MAQSDNQRKSFNAVQGRRSMKKTSQDESSFGWQINDPYDKSKMSEPEISEIK